MALLPVGTSTKIYDAYVSVIRGSPVLVSRATGVEIRVTVCSSLVQARVALKEVRNLQCRSN